jgi:hypothetical protein
MQAVELVQQTAQLVLLVLAAVEHRLQEVLHL